MASVTKDNEDNKADSEESSKLAKAVEADERMEAPDADDVRELESPARPPRTAGLFTIYKKGQGVWTRLGTLFAIGLLIVMLAYTLATQIPVYFYNQSDPAAVQTGKAVGRSVGVGFLVIVSIIALRLMNKPGNVDFLIATDSEMKKVNWTSRKELIGSSKVVIIFMFMIAAYLFLNDIIWGYLMYGISVLKTKPLGL